MSDSSIEILTTPRRDDLDLTRIANGAGLSVSVLPSGAIFAIEHTEANRRIMINQTLALPIANGMGRLYLRVGGPQPTILPVIGPGGGASRRRVGRPLCLGGRRERRRPSGHPLAASAIERMVLAGRARQSPQRAAPLRRCPDPGSRARRSGLPDEQRGLRQPVSRPSCRAIIRAWATVLMGRQNLSQGGAYPWAAHGCLEGAAGFATDFRQFMGPEYRDADRLGVPFGTSLPSERLQFETACAALQSKAVTLEPGGETSWTFFGLFEPDHPAASSDADLSQVEIIARASKDWSERDVALSEPPRSLLHGARSAVAETLDDKAIRARYRRRTHVERAGDHLLSFFVPGRTHSRHVVLRDKEHVVARRHGSLVRSGQEMLPDEGILCATAWMHGVFGAQLTIGNTSFHKLFSVSRDPYNITRASGLRMLMETKDGWRLLTVPVRFRNGPQRLPLGLSAWTADRHGFCNRLRRRARHAVARHGGRAEMPLSYFWPPRPRRAGICPCRPNGDRPEAKALHVPPGSQ